MTVEELIESLRAMPPTSRVEIETVERYEDPISVKYEMAVTYIMCDPGEEKDA